ncbi:MAG: hypothetical protein WB586_06170 [Chthoniobacterales bacterium]
MTLLLFDIDGTLPGIFSLLDRAPGLACVCGLLTGNLERGAMLKLAAHSPDFLFADFSNTEAVLSALSLPFSIAGQWGGC